jgi:hypothetical protein
MAHWGIAISQRANPLVGSRCGGVKAAWLPLKKPKRSALRLRERDYINAIELFTKTSTSSIIAHESYL